MTYQLTEKATAQFQDFHNLQEFLNSLTDKELEDWSSRAGSKDLKRASSLVHAAFVLYRNETGYSTFEHDEGFGLAKYLDFALTVTAGVRDGVMSQTGEFRLSNFDACSFKITEKGIKHHEDYNKIHRRVLRWVRNIFTKAA